VARNGYPRDSNTNSSGRLASLEICCASSVRTRSWGETAAVLAAVGPWRRRMPQCASSFFSMGDVVAIVLASPGKHPARRDGVTPGLHGLALELHRDEKNPP